nr:L-serine ammonia-lyase [uncultured Amphritea sp.]
MAISVFDLFKIGIGPSSSHTVGPMRAAASFSHELQLSGLLSQVVRIQIELLGSLGATGIGHASDMAVILGLEGQQPDTAEPEVMQQRLKEIRKQGQLRLPDGHSIPFNEADDLKLILTPLPQHPNGMRFSARDAAGITLLNREYFSIGGGFVVDDAALKNAAAKDSDLIDAQTPYPFDSMEQLLGHCQREGLSISDIMLANEQQWRSRAEINEQLMIIWQAMQDCVNRGCQQEGILPGGLNVKRRAAELHRKLTSRPEQSLRDPLSALDWVSLYALAVNEENAAGGRVVTAPTNGAAGIVPSVLHYYMRFYYSGNESGVIRFLLTAAAIGILCKKNASISGAEVGCQGEVGAACSMAAAGLAAVSGGTPQQIENAAEIAMEHNLGLTCDPIAGLVQVPCIERNAMAAVKAINACRIALNGDGEHFVSLDKVIKTMKQTGIDMQSKYKETSLGGLAVNVIEC